MLPIDEEHLALVKMPEDENPQLWRYMSLKKFENLLNDRCLYFCNTETMAEEMDPFEGSLPRIEKDWNTKVLQLPITFSRTIKEMRKSVFINCWQINDNESDAMWKLYLPEYDGIAIKTNYLRLNDTLSSAFVRSEGYNESNCKICLSKVRYIDYRTKGWRDEIEYPYTGLNLRTPFVHKRIEFKHESEFRLLVFDESDRQVRPKGIRIEVSLARLIDQVILPPKLKEGFENQVKEMISEFNYHFIVKQSEMSSEVYF